MTKSFFIRRSANQVATTGSLNLTSSITRRRSGPLIERSTIAVGIVGIPGDLSMTTVSSLYRYSL